MPASASSARRSSSPPASERRPHDARSNRFGAPPAPAPDRVRRSPRARSSCASATGSSASATSSSRARGARSTTAPRCPSRRGQIYDRSGTVVLAASVTRDRLIVSAEHMTDAASAPRWPAFLTAQLEPRRGRPPRPSRRKLETGKPYLVLARDLAAGAVRRRSRRRPRAAGHRRHLLRVRLGPELPAGRRRPEQHPRGAPHRLRQPRGRRASTASSSSTRTCSSGEPKVVEADRDASGKPLAETERTVEPGRARARTSG